MRAGDLSMIQQMLTQEAACVLNRSIEEAGRRNHGQTTPLHVAATLLASPTGLLLRQACMSSHPNSSHPLQCRALDLCFRVALERLPSVGQKVLDTPLSNALTAALKRAQAHQRRGCPENMQQPLLAIKVELEQLIISILDDPSVSKVMREASFSSLAVKAVIEQSMGSPASIGNRFRPPCLPCPSPVRGDEARQVIEIMTRRKKRNPIIIGESEPAVVVKEVLRRIVNGEIGEGLLKNAEVISFDNQIPRKIKELGARIRNSNNRGIVLDLGDLKWLMEHPEISRPALAEMGKILSEDDGGSHGVRLWLIGTASCETYLRCQVYHSSMEKDWDLQAVPIAARARSSLSGIIPIKAGKNGSHNHNHNHPSCRSNYEPRRPPLLPRWLQNAKPNNQEMEDDRSSDNQELHKKWMETSSLLLCTNPDAPPTSPVRTDLVLGHQKANSNCFKNLFSKGEDAGTFKKLLKSLMEKSWWQKEAASTLASAITRTQSGNGKRRAGLPKGDSWILFTGPDRISKTNMASVISEHMFGTHPILISPVSRREDKTDIRFRGKTSVDRIVDSVRRNPFAVIVLVDIDKADVLLRRSIEQAMESGRLKDSHGREISLGNIIFILTTNQEDPNESQYADNSNWQLKVSVHRSSKRRADWLSDEEEDRTKIQRKGLPLDLNLLAAEDETHVCQDENMLTSSTTTGPHELAIRTDDIIVFKSVNFINLRREIQNRMEESFAILVGKEHTLELEANAVEKLVGEIWLGRIILNDWMEKMVSPIFGQLRPHLSGKPTAVVRLQLDGDSDQVTIRGQVRLVLEATNNIT